MRNTQKTELEVQVNQEKNLMTNQTYIFESPWIVGDSLVPYRIVAYKRANAFHPERAYVTHIEVDPRGSRNATRYKVHGNYDLTHDEAINDAMKRYQSKVGK